MNPSNRGYAARRKFLGLSLGMIVVLLVIILAGGLLWWGRSPLIAMIFPQQNPCRSGVRVPVPISGMVIPAYTKINRDHIWNGKGGDWAVLSICKEQVTPEMIVNRTEILGRVMDHDKPPAYAFTDADFLPVGTRAGLTAGIPAGKRAMRVPVDKIPGLVGLLAGDRFDLVSTIPIDAGNATSLAGGGLYGKQLDLQARLSNWQKQATVRVVVQNGDVVQAMTTRNIPIANNTLTQGTVIRTKPVQEVVIAVSPSEVAHLSEALAVGADISCVPRSGRPDDPRSSITPESSPVSPFGGTASGLTRSAPADDSPAKAPSASVTGSTPASPLGGTFGNGFTQIETISGNKREIVATPVKR